MNMAARVRSAWMAMIAVIASLMASSFAVAGPGWHGGYYGGWRGGYAGWHGGWGWGWGWGLGWGVGAGLYLSTLPLYYSTYWWGGVPYYYAYDNYYLWNPTVNAYQSVSPPPGAAGRAMAPQAAQSAAVFAYPKNGQSTEQQAKDRFECHRVAASQSGFDPTASVVAVPASAQGTGGGQTPSGAASPAQREEYQKAQSACLQGRGYSVK